MSYLILYFVVCIYLFQITISQTNCSAIASNVYISTTNETLLSSQALFEPYVYRVPQTPLIQLSTDDDICNHIIQTHISQKILLITSANGICTNGVKIVAAQTANALAVLLEMPDELGLIDNIGIDREIITTDITIPARGISSASAQYLQDELNDGRTIEIEFTCNESEYPSILCIVDYTGDHWWLDGDYQLQIGKTKNGHPIWIKEGYTTVTVDHYLFLHSGDGANEWKWAITQDKNMNDDYYIVAYCNTGSVYEPSDCDTWMTTDYFITNGESDTFSINDAFKVNDTLCELAENYLCIQSTQSNLAGLSGEYRQWNDNLPYWFREFNDCDEAPGYLIFHDDRYFSLVDSMDNWIIAQCDIGDGFSDNQIEYIQYDPENYCEEWITLNDGSLDETNVEIDDTFTIESSRCDDSEECPDDESPPDELCLSENSVMHSFLEGSYTKTSAVGKYQTFEYERTEPINYNGVNVDVYIWYYGEISDTYKWWVIASSNYSTAKANNGSGIYGYCPASVNNPVNCKSCWNFYFTSDTNYYGDWHSDCGFEMSEGECEPETTRSDLEWPEYMCVSINESIYEGSITPDKIRGGYLLNETDTALSGGVPHWTKPANNYVGYAYHIYYDALFGYWQIGPAIHVDTHLLCMEDDDYTPEGCDDWYDITNSSVALLHSSLIVSSDDCDENSMLTLDIPSGTGGLTGGVIFLIILLVLVGCGCIIGGLYYYKKGNQSGGGSMTSHKGSDKIRQDSGSIELGDDMDAADLPLQTNTNTGGMDMSPLNVEGNNITNLGVDDDDDDSAVDKQQHDVVDDNDDDDEELLGHNVVNTRNDDGDDGEHDLVLPMASTTNGGVIQNDDAEKVGFI